MASRRLLKHTVTMLLYLGEVDNRADYQEVILEHCYCPLLFGTSLSKQGVEGNDKTRLYIFDVGTVAKDTNGSKLSYLPYSEWSDLSDKAGYWTMSGKGKDFILANGVKLRIEQAVHRVNGSRRMWHWEVDCV